VSGSLRVSGSRRVPLGEVAREWTRIGVTGFGGPPTHIALLRRLVVERREWIAERDFEDALAGCNLLPGPASTQLAIFCARRVAGTAGAVVGGLGFIVPSVVAIIVLSALFLAHSPPDWIRGAGAGAGAAVAAVAMSAGLGLLGPSLRRTRGHRAERARWVVYLTVGAVAGASLGTYLVLVLLGCGLVELAASEWRGREAGSIAAPFVLASAGAGAGGLGALAWVAFKVGALSFGGGFVIVPLMRGDAVHVYHWMTGSQFLSAVALGQITPGPVVATVAAVGYAAHGVGGAILAAVVAFVPSFALILLSARHFERLRTDRRARSFLGGAGPAAIGAILGAAIPLAGELTETWQFVLLGAAALVLLVARRAIVPTLLAAGAVGVVVALAGGPLP
jgi:chromate transporter